MKCPVDSATLLMSERQGVEIDYCPECRGVWLDRGELDKLLRQADDDWDDDDRGRGRQDDRRPDDRHDAYPPEEEEEGVAQRDVRDGLTPMTHPADPLQGDPVPKQPRDDERIYSTPEVVAKLRRLADALESGNRSASRSRANGSTYPDGLSSVWNTREREMPTRSRFQLRWSHDRDPGETVDDEEQASRRTPRTSCRLHVE